MVKRTLFVLALALAVGACEVPALAVPSIAGIGDVRVLDTRFVPTSDSGPGLPSAGTTYVLLKVELSNASARDFTPEIARFFLTTAQHQRYQGIDSGASAFAGVSNSHRLLKQGEKRVYAVGFRAADPVVAGTVSYEP